MYETCIGNNRVIFTTILKMSSELSEISSHLTELLRRQGGKIDRGELIAEIHDFLAMLEGLKPVFLHGRGLAPPHWIEHVVKIATDLELYVEEGPFWDATAYGEFPKWYADHCRAELQPYRAWYICSDPAIANAVKKINDANGRLSMTEEARLLGYPECCVGAHYERAERYHRGSLAILKRLAKGDETRMRDLFFGGAHLAPVTQQEINDFDEAFEIHEPAFGSWNMCRACKNETNRTSKELAQQYSEVIQKAELKLN